MFRYHRHRLTPTQVGIACWSVHPARTETREREYHYIRAYEENKADTTKLESCYHPLFPTASTSSSSFKSPTLANLDFWSETPLLWVGGRDGPLGRPRRARFHNHVLCVQMQTCRLNTLSILMQTQVNLDRTRSIDRQMFLIADQTRVGLTSDRRLPISLQI